MTETAKKTITITEKDNEQRLDRWLQQNYSHVTYAFIQKAMRKGDIRLDGKRVEGKERLATGQELRLPPAFHHAPEPGEFRPLSDEELKLAKWITTFEDRSIIAMNKPSGLATQGGTKTFRHVDRLLHAFTDKWGERPKLVHRLDKDTSGIMIAARTRQAATYLASAFKYRHARKTYLALTLGVPRSYNDKIRRPLLKTTTPDGEKMVIDKEGKDAITVYSVLSFHGREVALVALRPETGRMHQLRAHLAHIHCPILGDTKYGGIIDEGMLAEASHERLWLHALYLHVPHPDSEKTIDLYAPVPKEMARWIDEWNLTVPTVTDTAKPIDPMEELTTITRV